MVGRLLVGFVWLNLQFSVSWQVDFQWGSCGPIFSFLCHGWQTFSGIRVAQSLVFCVMVGRLLVGFVWLNLQFSVSWLVDFQWGSCGSNFSFLCHGRQTFSGVRVAQSLVFCVMVGRLLVGFVRLNLQFSVSRLATFSGVRVAQSLVFCLMVGRLLVGFRVAQSLVFCVMVHIILVGFMCLNLLFSASWLGDFQWGSCGSNLVFCVMVGRLLVGFVWLNLQFSASWLVDFQWGSCGLIFCFLCHGWQTFSGLRVSQSLVLCVMVGRLLVGFVWLNLQFSVSWLVDFQWASCGSIFRFLCHGRYTFSGVRVAQSFVFCVMVGRLLVGFVWLNLQFSVAWFVDHCLFCYTFFLQTIMLSVIIRFTASVCPFGISKYLQAGKRPLTFSGHSFNIGPYGKKCFKIFSSETSNPIQQTCHRWSLGGQLPKLCSLTPIWVQNGCRQQAQF